MFYTDMWTSSTSNGIGEYVKTAAATAEYVDIII